MTVASRHTKIQLCILKASSAGFFQYYLRSGASSFGQISDVIIYMKQLLDSDWPRALQFKCNTNANLHIEILDYD